MWQSETCCQFFHRSTTATAILKTKQILLELPQHKLIQDVSTRWNSTYEMLQRYAEQQPAVYATLLSKDIKKNAKDVMTLSDDDITDIEHIIKILEPIKIITTLLCDEKSPTLSMIHPLKELILSHMKETPDDSNMVKSIKQAITKDLQPR